MFGCNILISNLQCDTTLLEETYVFGVKDSREHSPLATPARHPKDSLPPWGTQLELIRRSQEIVDALESPLVSADASTPLLARTI